MAAHGDSANGRVSPAAFPPPVDPQKEFIKRGLDAEEELIEVGVAIVGGGTAGLACANRLLQLLADDPETMERLGEVPVAVIEKAKTCGGHNLSGAVMRPGPLQELFPEMTREDWRKQGFAYGEVRKEAVYLLPSAKTKLRIPPPPPFKNHGNEVVSVSAMARYQQRQAEEAGAYVLTETSATQLIVEDGATVSAMFQAHTFEDRVLKMDYVHVRRGATLGTASVPLYGADIGAGAYVAPHSVVMKDEHLLPGVRYAGAPAGIGAKGFSPQSHGDTEKNNVKSKARDHGGGGGHGGAG